MTWESTSARITRRTRRSTWPSRFPSPNSTTPFPEASSIIVSDGLYQLSRILPRGIR
ncbi:hypothetical protein BD309DRAFT_945542 [Dichomitus squalens]|uniref:Uncharacterized protein n=1 Tax=Dichomitus squalens TaxID=114155 RepID=A0A4Q9P7D8_9APHY|nr:hypothetical protein BD309DRAFT_945542 [Dichomitus squalens]TBU62960.1 hypothetical protein BD310DRAFT_917516 [Dichomitus squalens]